MFTYIQLYILRVKYGFDVYITENVFNHLRMLFDNVSGKPKKIIVIPSEETNQFIIFSECKIFGSNRQFSIPNSREVSLWVQEIFPRVQVTAGEGW